MTFYIAIQGDKASIFKSRLSHGIKPSLPNVTFLGQFGTKGQAEKSIPAGYYYQGKLVGLQS